MAAAQREKIEAIVHDYILKHPEVVIQSLEVAEEKTKAEAEAQQRGTIRDKQKELLADPADPVGGNPAGDVTIVEFFDYRCPYCKEVEPSLASLLRDDSKLRLVYKELPVLGAPSLYASRVALAMRKQGKYDAVHAALFAAKGTLDERTILQIASSAGGDAERAKLDLAAPEIEAQLKHNSELAQALLIRGTPAFIIGDELLPGVVDIATLKQKIAALRKG